MEWRGQKVMVLSDYILKKYGILLVSEEFLKRLFTKSDIESLGGGCAFQLDDTKKYIWVDKNLPKAEKQFVYYHEIAHILFGHANSSRTVKHKSHQTTANSFAATLVALQLYNDWKECRNDRRKSRTRQEYLHRT